MPPTRGGSPRDHPSCIAEGASGTATAGAPWRRRSSCMVHFRRHAISMTLITRMCRHGLTRTSTTADGWHPCNQLAPTQPPACHDCCRRQAAMQSTVSQPEVSALSVRVDMVHHPRMHARRKVFMQRRCKLFLRRRCLTAMPGTCNATKPWLPLRCTRPMPQTCSRDLPRLPKMGKGHMQRRHAVMQPTASLRTTDGKQPCSRRQAAHAHVPRTASISAADGKRPCSRR